MTDSGQGKTKMGHYCHIYQNEQVVSALPPSANTPSENTFVLMKLWKPLMATYIEIYLALFPVALCGTVP